MSVSEGSSERLSTTSSVVSSVLSPAVSSVVFCVFGTCFVVYCAYYALRAISKKKAQKKACV